MYSIKKIVALGVALAMVLLAFAALMGSPAVPNGKSATSFATTSTSNVNNSTLYLSPGPTAAFVDNFNPFDGVWLTPAGIMGLIYEPLFQINTYNGTVIPWLATNYTWNSNATVLTMYLRHNVTFSNGMPFNASDVVYTFNEQKKLFDEWGLITNITAVTQYEVKFTFSQPSLTWFWYVGSNIMIPAPLFQNVSTPQSEIVTNPVGTGPYVLSSFSPQEIVLTKNPHYWMSGEPKINRVVYVDYTSNSALALALAEGKVQWASVFEPNLTQLFVENNPKYNHYWFSPGQPVTLLLNNLVWPLNLSFVRQAISVSINRTAIMNVGEYGYETPANAANVLEQQIGELNSTNAALASKLAQYNVSYAKQILASHGYNIVNGHLTAPNGTAVPALTLMSVAGYTDWDTDISLISSELQAIGITVNTETPTSSVVSGDVADGQYQMAYYVDTGIGPNAWYDYSGLVGSVEPVGTNAYVNPERWNVPSAFMNAYNQFPASSNQSEQITLINEMVSTELQQMPIISTVYSANWYEYVNNTIQGWPNANSPYWIPMPWYPGPNEVVVLHLQPQVNNVSSPLNPLYYDIAGVVIAIVIVGAVAGVYMRNKRLKGR